ncbi:hypothetical protein D5018_20545 [Parashewanella curva]|uniref:Uncharacterized protein n=1 Tax=Parashewanella curva TaxID=2338552 RepID=A0A3L8PR44_9GAMM|nr:hypothetical protein [Parashewanella curva]RLV57815.1 hypothetical protein D5018_20545 [Parashewanella curva]
MAFRLWTYKRPFHYEGNNYEVKYFCSLTTYTSQLYCNGSLIDECTHSFDGDFKVVKHKFQSPSHSQKLVVSVGYYNWLNVGIEVRDNDTLVYASHPEKDIHFATDKLESLGISDSSPEADEKRQQQKEQWKKNKPSLLADIGIGAAFFMVAKITGDLTLAAFTGVSLGLMLVVIQRFVKVDLLGGFAVFGTVMLLISALFSIGFQSEALVQLKGTFMGIISASALIVDGIFNKGCYFGARFERYVNKQIKYQFFVLGLAVIGLCMAAINYAVATQLSEDMWLTYDTYVEMPIYLLMLCILIWRADKKTKISD